MLLHPKITVLMPVHNGERYLREAVESILAQTFADFEFLIIDDGSTDKSLEIISSYEDERLRVVRNQTNLGLTVSLNTGLQLARGQYIARMDCDDVSLPERLDRQISFMESHPEVGACGTWIETIGEPAGHIWRYPTSPHAIKCRLLFTSALAHPTVMMRREKLLAVGLSYNPSFKRAQDYELWVRLSDYCSLANIGDVLLYYRMHSDQVGQREFGGQQESVRRVRLTQLKRLGIVPTEEESDIHHAIASDRFPAHSDFLKNAGDWLCKLKSSNDRHRIYPEPSFSEALSEQWLSLCQAVFGSRFWSADVFWQSPLSRPARSSWKQLLKFGIKRQRWRFGRLYASRSTRIVSTNL